MSEECFEVVNFGSAESSDLVIKLESGNRNFNCQGSRLTTASEEMKAWFENKERQYDFGTLLKAEISHFATRLVMTFACMWRTLESFLKPLLRAREEGF